jgi:hypothetical protein
LSTFLDDLERQEIDPEFKAKPFFQIVKKNKKERHDWFKEVFNALVSQAETRTRQQRENLRLYRGVETTLRNRHIDRDRNLRKLNKLQKFVINHLYDLTETKVSQMSRIKPNVEVLPTNDEWRDRASAKVVNYIIKHLWYINNIDFMIQNAHRYARIFGEVFIFVLWDKTKGDLHPAYVKARDMGLKEVELDGYGKFDIDKPLKTGDVKYELEVPWRVLPQRKKAFCDVEYTFRVTLQPKEKLKKDYKGKSFDGDDYTYMFDMESLQDIHVEDHIPVIEFYHKHTEDVSKGYYCKFTQSDILEEEDLPFSHGELPFVRLTDLDVPEVMNGVSRYETIAPIQKMYNNINTLIAKNIYLTAHAKWVMPRGAAKIEQLGNDNTVVQFQGPIAPQLVQTQPNPPELYAYKDQLKEEMQTVYGIHGPSRGEVPKGITAASALQFLNELESERATTDIAKHGFLIKDLAKMTIAVAGEYYDPSDGRMVRIVGENNKYLIRQFDSAHLHKSYDVRFDNSTGLPETKAAKMQRILDAMQRAPQMLSPERWEELLELGNTEKYYTLTTAAVQAADSENEDLLAGREVASVQEWEDHIAHWESHSKVIQSRQFKEEVDPESRQRFIEHVRLTEKAMFRKAESNPEFAAKMATLTNFPLFFHKGAQMPLSREHQAAMVQGQANRGDQVTGVIPGVSSEDSAQAEINEKRIKGGK